MSVVLTDLTDNILTITLNRPEAGNALNGELGQAILDALKNASEDEEIRAVILTGTGEKIFCAGMDLKAFAAGENIAAVGQAFVALREFPKPLIAGVNGQALAGGFEVMMSCDLVVAVEHARFGIPEVKRGLFAAGGGTRLPRRIPLAIALEMGMTGDPIDAPRALSLGLINQVVAPAGLMGAARALAARVTANGPLAVQATKQLMYSEIGAADSKLTSEMTGKVFGSEDAKEGARAFAEKRAPVWKGR